MIRLLKHLLLVSVGPMILGTVASLCPKLPEELPTGSCVTYPSTGFCGKLLQTQKIYVIEGFDTDTLDGLALALAELLEANTGVVNNACKIAANEFVCNNLYMPCSSNKNNPTEGIPQPICQSYCVSFWKECQVAFDSFLIAAIFGLNEPAASFAFPFCGPNATFTELDEPPDRFGGRNISGLGPTPLGYHGQLRNPPDGTLTPFRLLDGSISTQACVVPTTTISQPLALPNSQIECAFPLVPQNGDCKIPCPFPVIPVNQQFDIGLAFVIPAVIALLFCIFVFADSMLVILQSQGFSYFLSLPRRYFKTSTNEATDVEGSANNGLNGKSGSRRRRNALRAATLYSLLGALLGIVFFIIGPMVTLIRGTDVSCAEGGQEFDLLDVVLGTADQSDGLCKAQRVSPFILQMIFNLILYAIVRVFMVVTDKARRMSTRGSVIFDVLLVGYCAGIPIAFAIITMSIEGLSTNLDDFVSQFSRNSAICVPRLFNGAEIILIFMPFILTGLMITALSYYIYSHLTTINENVKGITRDQDKSKNSSATALRLLMLRLSALGVCTFVITLVFISASASLIQEMNVFAPAFNTFFLCVSTAAASCRNCTDFQIDMLDKLPSSVAFAAQIAAMSSISLLFGGFFFAQSASRLYKEYQDGTLKLKMTNLWQGRPGDYNKEMESSFQSFSEAPKRLPELVKDSCTALCFLRLKKWRQSIRDKGRARGQVFRWVKGNNNNPKAKSPVFSVNQAWIPGSKSADKDRNIHWEGIIGSPANSSEPSKTWSSSNSNFKGIGAATSVTRSIVHGYAQEASWGYSETKLSDATKSKSVFDNSESSHASKPPKMPEI